MDATVPTLSGLKRKYSAAFYSYIRVQNLRELYAAFSADSAAELKFTYGPYLTSERTETRLHQLRESLASIRADDEASRAFLEWRITEAELLRLFIRAHEQGKNISVKAVEAYRTRQVELYGPLDERLFGGIVGFLRKLADEKGTLRAQQYMSEIAELLGNVPDEPLYEPPKEVFKHYQKAFREAFPELHAVIQTIQPNKSYSTEEIEEIFQRALEAVGATELGWKTRVTDGGANISVSKYRKWVVISRHLNPRTAHRLKQIVAHEVGCHVQGALHHASVPRRAGFDENDEGLALVLEQLFSARFIYKRTMRYLAVCLGYGLDGVPRDFRQVHEILWRAMVVLGSTEDLARERAFYETVRAFRGGLPMVAGMVYIKDKIYLEGNLLAWRQLEQRMLSAEEFTELFRSRDTIWARNILS